MHIFTLPRFRASLLIVIVFLLMYGTIASGQPRIKFEETVYDFGLVKEGKNITHVYRFQNVGDQTLKDIKVKTT